MKSTGWSAFVCALALTGCSAPATVQPTGDRVASASAASEDYKLGVGDKVRINVFHEDTLSGDFTIGSSGNLSLPLIGTVPALGKTLPEVSADIGQRLAGGYVRDPKVSMEVVTYRPFYILGEVKSPGNYPFVNGLTAMNAIATAQGFTPRANQHMVYIRRDGASEEVPYKLTPDLRVLPGDTLRLGERYF
ncbi:polysaccharide biosynthesis/export family protein [Sphingomonas sp. ID0503]|uniref:polysaccharide biosynthesis/export family protein n=1 Tax=Sphingomonas sp. ID0503 TaxID=3399691 RepID=UPI003AFAB6E3